MWMASLYQTMVDCLGLEQSGATLTLGQMCARCLVVLLVGLLAGRLADRRAIGANAAFDVMLGVVLGSVLSRGINGQAAFFPTLGVSLFLVLLHRIFARLACTSHTVSWMLKGRASLLIKNGVADEREMRRNDITMDDLIENLRMNGNVTNVSDVREAWFERGGKISVVPRDEAAGSS